MNNTTSIMNNIQLFDNRTFEVLEGINELLDSLLQTVGINRQLYVDFFNMAVNQYISRTPQLQNPPFSVLNSNELVLQLSGWLHGAIVERMGQRLPMSAVANSFSNRSSYPSELQFENNLQHSMAPTFSSCSCD